MLYRGICAYTHNVEYSLMEGKQMVRFRDSYHNENKRQPTEAKTETKECQFGKDISKLNCPVRKLSCFVCDSNFI